MLAVLLAGGNALSQPLGQLTMYVYSIASLVMFIWGLQKIGEVRLSLPSLSPNPTDSSSRLQENGPKSLIYAHLFALDHLVGTLYTALFAAIWYLYTPHDGRRIANSDAQKAMMGNNTGTGLDDAGRVEAAMGVWKSERGFSGAVLLIGWMLKASKRFIFSDIGAVHSHGAHAGVLHHVPVFIRPARPTRHLFSTSQIILQHYPFFEIRHSRFLALWISSTCPQLFNRRS